MDKTGGGAATKQTASRRRPKRAASNGQKPVRLTKDQLLENLKRRRATLVIGDGDIEVQGLTLNDFTAIRTMGEDETDIGAMFKRVCLIGCLDPAFDADDLDALGESDLATITLIANKIMGLSGMIGEESAADFLASIQTSRESSSTPPESSEGSRAS